MSFDLSYIFILIGRRKLLFDLLFRGALKLELSVFICDKIIPQLCHCFRKAEHDTLILVVKLLFSFGLGIQFRPLILELIEKIVVAF